MPIFNYIARDANGKRISGLEEVVSQDELISRLQARNLIIVDFKIQGELSAASIKKPKIKSRRFSHNGIKSQDLSTLARQMATLIAGGVSVLKTLEVIALQCDSKKLFSTLENIISDVRNGFPLHKAFSRNQASFSNIWINLIEIGEASGSLAIVLDRLAVYLEKREEFKSKIITSMMYPSILISFSTIVVIFFVLFIIPKFAEIYKMLGSELPGLTQAILNFSKFLKIGILPIIGLSVLGYFLLKRFLKTEKGKRGFDKTKFKLPIIGDVLKQLSIERFTSEMSTLVESGVPILYCLEISQRSASNIIMADAIGKIKDDVKDGKVLADPMDKSGLFPPMVVQMVSIGEEIGELPKMLKRLAEYYGQIVEAFIARFAAIFEPIMIIFVGGVILFLIVAMYLPIFKMASGPTGNINF